MKSLSIFSLIALIFGLITTCSSQENRQTFFNELAKSPEWKPDSVIAILEIKKGWHIGDLGAGGGYYTYRFAEKTGLVIEKEFEFLEKQYFFVIKKQ